MNSTSGRFGPRLRRRETAFDQEHLQLAWFDNVTIVYAGTTTCLAAVCACGHSTLIEQRLISPLLDSLKGGAFAQPPARGMLRFLAHFPSGIWIVLGVAVLLARLQGGAPVLSVAAAIIFAGSGVVSAVSIRRVHIGSVISFFAAVTAVVDTLANR